jgi:hypothetical protein
MSYSIGASTYEAWTQKDLDNAQLVFSGHLSNAQGEGLQVVTDFTGTQSTCDHAAFKQTRQLIDGLLQEMLHVRDPAKLDDVRYLLEATRFRSSWYGCQRLLDGMLSSATTTTEFQNSTQCVATYASDAYRNDPCCEAVTG